MAATRPEPKQSSTERELGPLPTVLRPLVDFVARVHATVHTKMLGGFLIIALLMLAMGALSIMVIGRMNDQVERLTELEEQRDLARQGLYGVTSQSHFRAMALITRVDSWNDKITAAKSQFASDVEAMAALDPDGDQARFERIRAIDERFDQESDQVQALYDQGDIPAALDLHVQAEHETSHDLEDELNAFILETGQRMDNQLEAFRSDRKFLTSTVALFSGVSLVAALTLGAIISWSLIRPVRKIDVALARIADGDFEQQVEVPNRDEFGRLTYNLNLTSTRLGTLYQELTSLNENLEKTIEEQVSQLRRTEELRRYVSPQVAEAVVTGRSLASLTSTRRNLTVLVSDIRGFTEMSERMEPEELVDSLNEYFTMMTDVVFEHGGTLDKYMGDAILAFFGDPIPFEDHAERAVATALQMRASLDELREQWLLRYDEELVIGIGISTGYVTVGNIGSPTRTEYTVIGNHVNIASRLSETTRSGQILVTERTMTAVREMVEGRLVEEIELKGVARPIRVFEISEKVHSA